MVKHSYMDDAEKNPNPESNKTDTQNIDKKNIGRTDPGLKKGYNEKNPSQPQGNFTPESQSEGQNKSAEGDESKESDPQEPISPSK